MATSCCDEKQEEPDSYTIIRDTEVSFSPSYKHAILIIFTGTVIINMERLLEGR